MRDPRLLREVGDLNHFEQSCLIAGAVSAMQRPQPETVTLDDILITEELSRRSRSLSEGLSVSVGEAALKGLGESPRPPNLQGENQALHTLARQLLHQPEMMLQTLVDIALDLCSAESAGVSLLETTPNGEELFRWNVLAGTLAHFVGRTIPRNFSPCGVCLDRGTPVLFSHPERYFTYFQAAKTPIVEGLVLPLIADNHALGSIWIMSHDEQRHFDGEDVRVMTSLADFTAAALLLNQRQTHQLLAKNAQLEVEVARSKQAEEAWRESEERFRAIVSQTTAGIARSDLSGSLTFVNQKLSQMLSYTEAELVGKTIQELTHPHDVPKSTKLFEQLMAVGTPFQIEKRLVRKDNSTIWVNVSVSAIRNAAGYSQSAVAVIVDISDRKRAEEEHIQLIREQAARAEAEQANRMKDEFLAMISHELQAPLVAVLGWTRLLRANLPNAAMLAKSLETIERNATLQAKLISDLLDISRISAGKVHLSLQSVELKWVIETAIASISHLAQVKGIDLVWSGVTGQQSDTLAPGNIDRVVVLGDRDRLGQIITNLLTNAIKFTPQKGSINVELSVIEGQNSSDASIAEISITDTGIGISAEFLPHVFDRFRQAQESSSSKGLGLGLAIARHLVELHGSTIHAASDGIGQGATFIVKLPLFQEF